MMAELNSQERLAVGLAIAVLVLSFVSILLFVYYRSSNFFYVTAALAVACGFYMAFHLSKQGTVTPTTKKGK